MDEKAVSQINGFGRLLLSILLVIFFVFFLAPIIDKMPIVKPLIKFIDEHIENGKVLVHCAMGISRSGGITIAWLLKENPKWSWTDALEYVNNSRLVYPAIEIRESVLDYFEAIEGKRRD